MATNVVDFVLDLPATVKGSHRLLLVTLATYADREGARVYPSLSTLARRTALSERQVRRILRQLETAGYLIMDAPEQQHLPCLYRLALNPVRADIAMSPLKSPQPARQGGHLAHSGGTFRASRADIAMSADPRDPRDPNTKNSGADAPRRAPKISTGRQTNPKTDPPAASYAVLEKLAFEVIDADPKQEWADRVDALKDRAAKLKIPYDGNVAGSALASAVFQRNQKKGSADDNESRHRRRRAGGHHGTSRAD